MLFDACCLYCTRISGGGTVLWRLVAASVVRVVGGAVLWRLVAAAVVRVGAWRHLVGHPQGVGSTKHQVGGTPFFNI